MSITPTVSPGKRSHTPASLAGVRSVRLHLASLVALAAVIRVAAFELGPVERLDARVLSAQRLWPGSTLHDLAVAITSPFDPLPYVLVVGSVLIAAVARGRGRAGLAGAGVMVGAAVTTQVLKQVLAAPRVPEGYRYLPPDAWPSGHTTAAAALGIALVLITPPGRRRPVVIGAAIMTAAVGVALVALRRHYPSDVLGGMC